MGIFDDLFLLRSFVSIVENGSISDKLDRIGGVSVGVDDP